MKRIFAWVLLVGFVLLILNLIVFRFYWQLSMVVYLVIVFAFLLTNGKLVKTKESDDPNSSDNRGKYLDDAVVLNDDTVDERNAANDKIIDADDENNTDDDAEDK